MNMLRLGYIIISQDSYPDSMYVILDGHAEVYETKVSRTTGDAVSYKVLIFTLLLAMGITRELFSFAVVIVLIISFSLPRIRLLPVSNTSLAGCIAWSWHIFWRNKFTLRG
jgi:hypothetical protein